MAPVIHLCSRCGFDVPVEDTTCPQCGPEPSAVPSRAARQLAGAALPTRSVRRLPGVRPRADRAPATLGPALGARAAFTSAWLLVAIAIVGLLLARVARLDRLVSSLPSGTAEWLEDLAIMASVGSVIGLLVGFVAMLAWCVRRIAATLRRRPRLRTLR